MVAYRHALSTELETLLTTERTSGVEAVIGNRMEAGPEQSVRRRLQSRALFHYRWEEKLRFKLNFFFFFLFFYKKY